MADALENLERDRRITRVVDEDGVVKGASLVGSAEDVVGEEVKASAEGAIEVGTGIWLAIRREGREQNAITRDDFRTIAVEDGDSIETTGERADLLALDEVTGGSGSRGSSRDEGRELGQGGRQGRRKRCK